MAKQAILGVNCFAHDTSACLVEAETGAVIYAIAEERLSNLKHETHFPIGSIRHCLNLAKHEGIEITAVAISAVSELLILDRVHGHLDGIDSELRSRIVSHLSSLLPYSDFYHLGRRGIASDCINDFIRCHVPEEYQERTKRICAFGYNWAVKLTRAKNYLKELLAPTLIVEVPHHLSHAASALFGAAFDKAAILVIDGQGEADAISMFASTENRLLTKTSSTPYPHSLGLIYLYATYHLGFSFGDEYKVMGMAAYGTPIFADELSNSIQVSPDGRLKLMPNELFEISQGPYGTAHVALKFLPRMQALVPSRANDEELTQAHFDFSASVQLAVERAGCQLAQTAIRLAGERQLILTGGVALNGLMNEQIRLRSGCERLFVYPASGDDGTAIGAAQWLAMARGARPKQEMRTSFYGGVAQPEEIEAQLQKYGLTYRKSSNIHREIAEAIASGEVVARFVGCSEFGPRALGNRSILADPRSPDMKDILNSRIKHRESFRPFAPACLVERVATYFEIECESSFMLLICQLKAGSEMLIPAVAHKDGTARVQTVEKNTNPDLYATIFEFEKITNVAVVINTSFNVNGEAIVETVVDAIESFLYMDIDCLAAGDFLIKKQDNLAAELSHMSSNDYLDMRRKRFRQSFCEPLRYFDMSVFFDALT